MRQFFNSLLRDVSDFSTLTPQVKFLLVLQFIVLFILSILVGVLFSPQFAGNVKQNPTPPVQEEVDASKTQLSVAPLDQIIKVGESARMSVTISGARATAVDVVLNYDPALIEITNVTNGNVYEREIVNSVEAGRLVFSVAQALGQVSEGTVFEFDVTALKKIETTHLEFDLTETITAENGVNTLGIAQPGQIHVFD